MLLTGEASPGLLSLGVASDAAEASEGAAEGRYCEFAVASWNALEDASVAEAAAADLEVPGALPVDAVPLGPS